MMNSQNKNDDSRFDRLVDGELTERERLELLTSLDQQQDGWRRCALAFLEAQCWQESLPGMFDAKKRRHGDSATPTMAMPTPASHFKPHWRSQMRNAMAMAACFMAALLIGSLLPRGRISPDMSGVNAGPVATNGATRSGNAMDRGGVQFAGARNGSSSEGPWQMVTLAPTDGQGDVSSMRLPAVERKSVDAAWLRDVPPAMPPEVLQALERTGHQVQQQRELVPVQMQDGRRLMVPVDQVDVHYQGNGAY